MSYKITWNIPDKNVADKFKELADKKLGNKKTRYGDELQKAMIQYMKNEEKTERQSKEDTKKEKIENEIERMSDLFDEKYPEGAEITRKQLQRDIRKVTGIRHLTTIEGRIDDLVNENLIEEKEDKSIIVRPDLLNEMLTIERSIGQINLPERTKTRILTCYATAFMSLREHAKPGFKFRVNDRTFRITEIIERNLRDAQFGNYKECGYRTDKALSNDMIKMYNKEELGNDTRVYIHRFEEL